ncbi:MAG: right-handed parallel beta-helix repeat-containing protein [Chloroflexi bacterium]|nr:right-handed parallel beta-helix repeat-containing protein [Chloroflexota bacterium]
MSIRERVAWAAAAVLGLMIVAAVTGVVSGGPLDPPGPPGATQPQVEPRNPIPPVGWAGTYPITLSSSGSYFLTQNLAPTGGNDGIVVNNGDISIDLNGFMIDGEAGGDDGISDNGIGYPNLTVGNGTIRGFADDGIDLQTSVNVRVSRITIGFSGGSGIEIGSGSVSECTATGPDTGTVGVRSAGAARISDCVVNGYGTGFALNGGGLLRDCVAASPDLNGIFASPGSTVMNCRVNGVGINAGTGSKYGMYVQGPSLIKDNAINTVLNSSFMDMGIYIEGPANVVTGNQISGVEFGLKFGGSASNSRVYGNTFDGVTTYFEGTVTDDDLGPIRPYEDGGSWDQTLTSVGTVSCNTPRFRCVMNDEAVLDRETGLVWQRTAVADTDQYWGAYQHCLFAWMAAPDGRGTALALHARTGPHPAHRPPVPWRRHHPVLLELDPVGSLLPGVRLRPPVLHRYRRAFRPRQEQLA